MKGGEKIKSNKMLTSFILKPGAWRNYFGKEQYQLMIANALNYCVFNEEDQPGLAFEVEIAGYLITSKKLCLVLNIELAHVERLLHFFYERMREEIRQEFSRNQMARQCLQDDETMLQEKLHGRNLFEKIPLYNFLLIQLITGQRISMRYYNPLLARLRHLVKHNRFCSVTDYTGGEGPVLITKIAPENTV